MSLSIPSIIEKFLDIEVDFVKRSKKNKKYIICLAHLASCFVKQIFGNSIPRDNINTNIDLIKSLFMILSSLFIQMIVFTLYEICRIMLNYSVNPVGFLRCFCWISILETAIFLVNFSLPLQNEEREFTKWTTAFISIFECASKCFLYCFLATFTADWAGIKIDYVSVLVDAIGFVPGGNITIILIAMFLCLVTRQPHTPIFFKILLGVSPKKLGV